jgi:LruC domain-containing protein
VITELCDVWVSFVTEGAGYRNSLGFFTFPSNNPPTSVSQITPHKIIMPNTSLVGSSGGMVSGDKVYIGQFPANTTIGWFIVADGWTTAGNVSTNKPVYYSIPSLNPEVAANKKKHSILVYDSIEEKLLVGFEDLPRENGSDEDFNDLIFYAKANPVEAIDIIDVPPIDTPVDTDGDGVSDTFDDYPTDPELAYNNYTFTENGWGTLAFEDLWPNKGDYDFNDMVLSYNINQITNGQNKVKKIGMTYKLRAIGARYANGFAVELPFSAANITDLVVSHPALFNLESSAPKAVMRFFNSSFDLIPQQAEGFINTVIGETYFTPVVFTATFKLQTPLAPSTFNFQPPYNPFIFVNGVRGHEVHLPGYTPTTLANTALFGTGDDNSVVGVRYYKTVNNHPWAINIATEFAYPIERAQITKAHLKFKVWAQSSGNSFPDWYLDNPGYRDEEFIYTHE